MKTLITMYRTDKEKARLVNLMSLAHVVIAASQSVDH